MGDAGLGISSLARQQIVYAGRKAIQWALILSIILTAFLHKMAQVPFPVPSAVAKLAVTIFWLIAMPVPMLVALLLRAWSLKRYQFPGRSSWVDLGRMYLRTFDWQAIDAFDLDACEETPRQPRIRFATQGRWAERLGT